MPNTKDQQKAIDTKDTSIIVSAGAGAGKTAVLKQRVARILKNDYFKDGRKVHINNLILLTFTKNAASEMKERIRKIINSEPSLKEEGELLDSSYITTFDSFSQSIVKKYNYLLGMSKNFTIVDDSIVNIEVSKILDNIFENYYAKNDEKFNEFVKNFSIKDDKLLKNNIITIYNQLQNKLDLDKYLNEYINNSYSKDYVNKLFDEFMKDIFKQRDDVVSLFDSLQDETIKEEIHEENANAISNFLYATTYDELASSINFSLKRADKNIYTDEGKKIKEQISEIIKNLKTKLYSNEKELKENYIQTQEYTNIIINIIKELKNEVMKFKDKHNAYSFNDIALKAIDLVRNYPEVKEYMNKNIYEIMVDEYQDTSDIQEEFIQNIQNNNVFMVGDVKQSIYRFRNANPYIFKSKYDLYKQNKGGIKIDLKENFRSRKEVIENVNLIFSDIMTDDIGGASFKEEHQMGFGNKKYEIYKDESQNYNMQILNYQTDENYPNNTKNIIEAFIIANDIKNKIKNKYKIKEQDKDYIRDCKYSDFAILIDKSNNFDLIKKIFEYNSIPTIIDKDSSIKEDDEIFILESIIKLIIKVHEIDNKTYESIEDQTLKNNWLNDFKHYFMSVARSYIYRTSDAELFKIILNNSYKNTDLYNKCLNISKKLDSISNKELLTTIIKEFDIVNKLITVGNVKDRLKKLEYFINNATSLNEFGMDIYSMSDYFDTIESNGTEDIKMSKSGIKSNAVKIMTIHVSKGLEFPIVYMPYLNSDFTKTSYIKNFSFDNKYGLILPFYDEGIGSTFIKDLANTNNKLEELSEKIRLLYVALTRPQEEFILINEFNPTAETKEINYSNLSNIKSYSDILELIKPDINKYIKNINLDEININYNYNIIQSKDYKKVIPKTEEKIITNKIVIDTKKVENKHFSKALNTVITKDIKETLEYGTYIHYIFETYDFNSDNLNELNISEKDKKYIINFLKHKEVKDISKAKIYKEHEIEFEQNDTIFHGFIDLLVEYKDYFDIIDYKLSNIDSPEYERQLNGYKSYIENTYNKKTNIYLYSIFKDELKKIN